MIAKIAVVVVAFPVSFCVGFVLIQAVLPLPAVKWLASIVGV